MTEVLVFALIAIFSYAIGNFSAARIIAKSFKSLNVYKVGTGHPDTENIYENVDKTLGVLVGIVDAGKMYLYLTILKMIFLRFNIFCDSGDCQNDLLIFGLATIIGHCFPILHYFKGGRGIFTYVGFMLFFAFYPMAIVLVLSSLIILFFNQIRFSKYLVVLLPPLLAFFFPQFAKPFIAKMIITAILMGILNFLVSKRMGEI